MSQQFAEREARLGHIADALDEKMEERVKDLRERMNDRFEEISQNRQRDLVQRIVSLSDQIQSYTSDFSQQLKQMTQSMTHFKSEHELQQAHMDQQGQVLEQEVKTKLKELIKQRQDDVKMITEMVEAVQKKAVSELAKRQQAIKHEVQEETAQRLSEAIQTLKQHTETQLEDKVRVDEVQDALKKITDGFHAKLNLLQENMQVYVTGSHAEASQGIVQLKENVAKMLTQLSTLIQEKQTLEQQVAVKVDEASL